MIFPPLSRDQVHVWCLNISRTPGEVESWTQYVPVEQHRNSDLCHDPLDRRRLLLSQALRRVILAGYAETDPGQLQFGVGAYGKPQVEKPAQAHPLGFNVAHSGNLVLLAVALHRRVGLDVERMEEGPVDLEVAERFFSTKEREALQHFPAERQRSAFYRAWTRKEAYIKAVGQGVHLDLSRFSVSLDQEGPIWLETDPAEAESRRWRFCNLQLEDPYVGCLVAEDTDWVERFFLLS